MLTGPRLNNPRPRPAASIKAGQAQFYRCRTLWRNAEAKREHSEANLFICMVRLMVRRLAGQTSQWHNQRVLNPVYSDF